jgi:hypothetical protein
MGVGERKVELAHRIAWVFAHGDIPAGLAVLHSCDIPICVRDQHLFLGTAGDNACDMVSKGRHWSTGDKRSDIVEKLSDAAKKQWADEHAVGHFQFGFTSHGR